jgi:nitrate/nitrite-specific signal transduction histidine kinase
MPKRLLIANELHDVISQKRNFLEVSVSSSYSVNFLLLSSSFFLWLYSPSQALAASMKLSFSLQLLDR